MVLCIKKIKYIQIPEVAHFVAKFLAVLKSMKCDYYVVKFWQKSEQVYFFGLERARRDMVFLRVIHSF